jgi:alkanesulfonate monooxygenase SsuD/methylene tetrahydromethanopterin reductase-like flavin-dependent oxidoreductase (luciferase family)
VTAALAVDGKEETQNMKYGFVIHGANISTLIELAKEVEAANWDGVFVADSIYWNEDPYITLAAIALNTKRVRLGTMITPVTRYRPWDLAMKVSTVDHLSHGRMILPIGLGAVDTGFANVGEVTDRKVRAERTDEGLEIIAGLWRKKVLNFAGKHFQLKNVKFGVKPVQTPRVPIWVVGAWPFDKSIQRALKYDGIAFAKMDTKGKFAETQPDDIRTFQAYARKHRKSSTKSASFDIVLEGMTDIEDRAKASAKVRPLMDAGVTWWIESMWGHPIFKHVGIVEGLRMRIRQGPPQVD